MANFENPDGKYQEDMLEEIKAALSTEELKDILAAEDFEKALADCIAMHEERKAKEKVGWGWGGGGELTRRWETHRSRAPD